MPRKRKYEIKDFYRFEATSSVKENNAGHRKHIYIDENGKEQTDTTTTICYSMLIHPAFKDLTARQRMLYVYAKTQFYGARSRPKKDFPDIAEFAEYDGRKYFYLNHFLMSDVFGMYPKSNHRDLYKDIAALVEHGFIEWYTEPKTIDKGNHMRTIYRYSDAWKQWKSGKVYIKEKGKVWKFVDAHPDCVYKCNRKNNRNIWEWVQTKKQKSCDKL